MIKFEENFASDEENGAEMCEPPAKGVKRKIKETTMWIESSWVSRFILISVKSFFEPTEGWS